MTGVYSVIQKKGKKLLMDKKNFKNNDGFTLIELIIVVSILAILIGILAPQYTKYVEKSRQTMDLANAREIQKQLDLALSLDDIRIPSTHNDYYGIWVMICKKGSNDYAPTPYHGKNFEGIWCGADNGVVIDGVTCTNASDPNPQLKSLLEKAGISSKSFRTYSSTGWDWIIIQVGYRKNGDPFSRIYSGFKDQNGSINQTQGQTNIEKLLYGNS